MSSSTKTDNRKKDISANSLKRSEHTLTAEKMHSNNLSKRHTKFCLSLHYNGANSC